MEHDKERVRGETGCQDQHLLPACMSEGCIALDYVSSQAVGHPGDIVGTRWAKNSELSICYCTVNQESPSTETLAKS
ncbi:hypothetical protein CY34DRAFT_804147 [Suillus luteus UH-Slu-Lm8-n1]|uniref:Uncharacterized protein n=1 Tax=Suillus luteus UH-Slu-Lm8-n1 TaxID=930992 RepID=A0A0D0B9W0_9AGAM|nr:hypothetical protein CY34DRAFT_804147 [Suillus luteus UH-Slu-Lm8-n1]